MTDVRILPELLEFDGKSPSGLSTRIIRLPLHKILSHYERVCNTSKLDESWWVPDVCMTPAGVWRGLDRKNQEEAFCYSNVPTGNFKKTYGGPEIEFPNGKVFLVFLDPEMEVTKWRKCKEDPDFPGFPIGHATRFGERTWLQD